MLKDDVKKPMNKEMLTEEHGVLHLGILNIKSYSWESGAENAPLFLLTPLPLSVIIPTTIKKKEEFSL